MQDTAVRYPCCSPVTPLAGYQFSVAVRGPLSRIKNDSYLDAAVAGHTTSTAITRFPPCPYLFANLTAARHAVLSSLSMLPLLARGASSFCCFLFAVIVTGLPIAYCPILVEMCIHMVVFPHNHYSLAGWLVAVRAACALLRASTISTGRSSS